MRYDQPPYPCPSCSKPRCLSLPEPGANDEDTSSGGTGQPVMFCAHGCPAQESVFCLSWREAIREARRRADLPVADHLDGQAGLFPRESNESLGLEIRQCWSEQTRNRGGKGGSSSKGRKKDAKGGVTFPGGNDDQSTGEEGDKHRHRGEKSALKSSVHSARLTGDQRRKLRDLQEKRGTNESETLGAAVEVAHALEEARGGEGLQRLPGSAASGGVRAEGDHRGGCCAEKGDLPRLPQDTQQREADPKESPPQEAFVQHVRQTNGADD